jgi:hypothetical protein
MRKQLLFYGLPAIMMAACSSDDSITLTNGSKDINENARYMAISLVANEQSTRAGETRSEETADAKENGYNLGSANEYAIADASNIVFYFFDANGNPFKVSGDKSYVTGTDVYVYDATTEDRHKVVETEEAEEGEGTEEANNEDGADADAAPRREASSSSNDTEETTPTADRTVTITTSGTEATSSILIVLENKSGDTPSKVVAVVNNGASPTPSNYTLDELRKKSIGYKTLDITTGTEAEKNLSTTSYFTMRNSAYKNSGGDLVYATTILPENIATSADAAESSPVQIYVERVVAKVTNNTKESSIKDSDGSNALSITLDGGTTTTTYSNLKVKFLGWKLFNTAQATSLIKNIDPASTSNHYYWPTNWNDWYSTDNHRSYWAAMDASKEANPSGATEIGTTTLSFNDITKYDATNKAITSNSTTDIEYPFENTLADEVNASNVSLDNHTSIVYAAQVVDASNNTPVTIARWLSKYYTEAQLKASITKVLANKLYTRAEVKDGETVTGYTYTAITEADIDFSCDNVYKGETYNVAPVLSTTGKAKVWYNKETGLPYAKEDTYNSTLEDGTSAESTTVTEVLKSVPKAQIWKDGYCYYFTQIKHPTVGTTTVPAIVRNHWYQLTVSGVNGLGTPVYDTTVSFDPIKPEDNNWYLDAKIHVLGWRVVEQNVTLE